MTGAAGFVGRPLLRALAEDGHEVSCVVRPSTEISAIAPYAAVIFPYGGYQQLYQIARETRPELVLHLAGLFLAEHSPDTIVDLLESSVLFPCVLLDAADRAGCGRLVNTGSYWQRYNGADYDPVNLYAAAKQALEDCAAYYVRAKNWKMLTLQMFDTYGPGDTRRKVLNLLHGLKDGESLAMSSGEQKMYFCYIDDVVDAYRQALRLLDAQPPGTARTYAVRGELPCSLREAAGVYLEVSGRRPALQWGVRPSRPREFLDPEGLGEVLPGWKPRYSLREGLRRYENGWN